MKIRKYLFLILLLSGCIFLVSCHNKDNKNGNINNINNTKKEQIQNAEKNKPAKERLAYDLFVSNETKKYSQNNVKFKNKVNNQDNSYNDFLVSDTQNVLSNKKKGLVIRGDKSDKKDIDGYAIFDFTLSRQITKIVFTPMLYNEKDKDSLKSFKVYGFINNEFKELYDATNDAIEAKEITISTNDFVINKFKFEVIASKDNARVILNNIKVYEGLNEVTITIDENQGKFIYSSLKVFENDYFNIKDKPVRKGYEFEKWINLETNEEVNQDTKITKDIKIQAVWTKKVKITFDFNGGILKENEKELDTLVVEKNIGDVIESEKDFPKPIKQGYKSDNLNYEIINDDYSISFVSFPLVIEKSITIKVSYDIDFKESSDNLSQVVDIFNTYQGREEYISKLEEFKLLDVSYTKVGNLSFLFDKYNNIILLNEKDDNKLQEHKLYNLVVRLTSFQYNKQNLDTILVAENITKVEELEGENSIPEMKLFKYSDIERLFNKKIANEEFLDIVTHINLENTQVLVEDNKVYLKDLNDENKVLIEVIQDSVNYKELLEKDGQKYKNIYLNVLGLNLKHNKLLVTLARQNGHILIIN